MEKSFVKFVQKFAGLVCASMSIALSLMLSSCGEDSGLGATIDTEAPKLEITYPAESGIAIRDSFILYGTCSDDKSVARVAVSVKSLEKSEGEKGYADDSFLAEVSSDSTTWSITLNDYDPDNPDYFNGWRYADGKYEVSATCYDNAGNNSGTYSKTFEIDNTPPVFIISNPGVVKSKNLSPSAYGSIFTIDGTISDNHTISTMDVAIYDESGSLVSHETYDSEQIDCFREEEISTAGGTSVTIAQYAESPTTTANTRYSDVYGSDSSAGTKYYYASVTLSDSAQVYQNPTGSSSRSAEEIKADEKGNETSKLYLYDDVYSSLMSTKKGLGLNASNLKDIISGITVNEDALDKLKDSVIDTASAGESDEFANKLSFSLNPEANPVYNVNGFEFAFSDNDTLQTASAGNTVSVTITAGLDNTNIAPEVVRVWMKEYSEKPSESDEDKIKADLLALETEVEKLELKETDFIDTIHAESGSATPVSTNDSENKWILIYDYSLNNSKGSSVSTKTFSVTLPEGISLSKYYILGVTGYDIEEVEFSQNTVYGFEGNTAGVAPTLTIESPDSLAIFGEFDSSSVFTGKATLSTNQLYISEISATLSITDESSSSQASVAKYTDSIKWINDWDDSTYGAISWNETSSTWKFDASKIQELVDLYNSKKDDGIYWLCTLTVEAKSSSGHSGEISRSIHIDTVAPTVSINSVTPNVSGEEYFGGSDTNTYLNGKITFKGTIEEQNLDSVSFDILAGGESVIEELGISGELGKVYSVSKEIDTSIITEKFATSSDSDPKIELEIRLTAVDKAGNSATYSSKALLGGEQNYVVYQETDRPKISLGNADATITSADDVNVDTNLFGTTSNNKLSISFEDDDAINSIFVTLYDKDGNKLQDGSYSGSDAVKVYEKYLNPYSININRTSHSINYILPETEGVYKVRIDAYDNNLIVTDLTDSESVNHKKVGDFYIAVDSGAPTLSVDSVSAYVSTSDSITGTVSPSTKSFDNGTSISAVFLDSELQELETQPATLSATMGGTAWTFPLSALPPNTSKKYILKITAEDKYHQKSSTNVTFSMDPNKPTIAEPTSEQTVKLDESSYVTLNVVVSDDTDGSGLSTVGYYLSEDNSAPSTYESVSWTAMNQTNTDWRTTFDISSIKNEDGILYAFFGAKDNAGNTQVSTSSIKLTIDKTAPSITVTGFDENAVSANGTAKTTSGNSFSVTVTDTNVASLSSSNSNVSVGSAGDVTGGKSYPVTVSWSSTDGKIEDSQNVTFTATDANGRTAEQKVTLACDNYAPRVTMENLQKYYTTAPLIKGSLTDANLTGTANDISVYLVSQTDSSVVKEGAVTLSESSWSAAFSGIDAGTYGIAIVASDTFGNKSAYTVGNAAVPAAAYTGSTSSLSETAITIDAISPEVTSVYVGTSENPTASVDSSFYTNGNSKIYIKGMVSDGSGGSGIDTDKVWIIPYSKVTGDTAVEANKATVSQDGTFTFTINSSDSEGNKIISKSGNVYIRVTDKAGNITDTSLFAITYDATAPKIQSYALSDNKSDYTAYNSGKDSSGNAVYYVNNGTSHTFTLSGIATDNLGLSSAVLSINDSKIDEITDEDSLSSYSFDSIDLSSYSGDASAKITLTDKAGNTAEQAFTIKLDTAAPQGSHDLDSANQDYIFRIGSGTGGKYSAGTYGNASTIQIRGYFNETGSGTNMIYYKLFSGSAPEADDAETFLKNYETSATGYFSPLSSEESAEVSSSVDSTTKTVTTNFKSNISGFQEGKNYLLLVAVDNVGNAALDNVVYSYTDESGTEVPVAGCYSINVDTTLPSVESDVSSTILTNGNGDITISGTASDSDAGIDSVAVKITVGTATYSSSDTDSKITVTTKTASGDTDNDLHWTATISKDAFSSVSSGNYTVYATATDKAGEGNSQTVSVANISVDKVAPTVTLTNPSDADSSTSDIEINGTIELSGTVKDENTLPDNGEDDASNTVTAIRYAQVASSSASAPANDASSWTNIDGLTITGNYTFNATGFDTTGITDEKYYYIQTVAVDKAGNTGYSEAKLVKVSQDTDRPVIKITNLNVQGSEYILKYGKDSQITATVTDDDGISTVVLSESPYDGTGTEPTTSVWTPNNETVTFTPSDKADGRKTVYVYVKDKANKEFWTTYKTDKSADNYLNIPKIKVADSRLAENASDADEKDALAFSYFSDSTSPTVENIEALTYKDDGTTVNGGYDSEKNSYDKYETVNASYVIGGTERQKVKFQISASDANGVAGMALEISYKAKKTDGETEDKSVKLRTSDKIADTDYVADTKGTFTPTAAGSTDNAIWITDLVDLSDSVTGNVTIKVIPYDNSGLQGNGNATFTADMTGPTVKVTSPSSTEHVSGSSILVSGIATDVGGSSTSAIQWGIPNKSGTIEKWQGELTATSSVSAWSFNFDGSSNASFSEFIDSEKYNVSESSDSIWTIPVYFKASDLLGNETVYKDFSLLYDPDADRPQTTLSYPGEADKKSGENYAILGGTIRTTGSVEIPDGSTSVWAVYMQISDDAGNFDNSDKARASNEKAVSDGVVAPTGYGYTVVDADAMETNWQKANSSTGTLNFHSTDSDKNSTYRNGWWGIKVTKNSGSWYVNLNSSGELNSNVSDSTNNIKVRFCGVSAEGKVGHWTEAYSIHIDSNVPKYTTAMYKYSSDITSVSNLYTEGTYTDSDSGIVTASKIKPYEADMYLKGQWYAFAKITDESSVKITGVKRGTTSLTYGTDYFVYPEAAGNDGENSSGSNLRVDSSDSASYVAYVWVKIDPSYTTTQTYTITAKDSDGTPNYIYPAFELNTDNTAPSLTALTDNSDTAISMTKLRNSDKGISFKTAATDTGSGFDKLLFYFKRTVTNNSTATTTIELPLPAGSSGAWTSGSDAAYVGTLTETDSDLDEGNELYGVTLSGTSSSDGSTTIFTSDSDISSYKFIRKGGVIKLSGVYYVISDVSGKAITVDSAVSGSPTSAFAAAAMVLDHVSTAEGWTWDNGSFKVAGDEDDDGFVEYIKKSGSTWTCEATIMGNQLEDGPISLVTVAFDKAENVTTTTTNVMIANNTPRLAKVFLATDLNGDEKFTDNEFGSSTIKNLNQTYKFYSALTNGTEGSASDVVTLSQSSDEATVGLTMRDSLAAAFEFVSGDDYEGYGSGNGDLYYKLDVGTSALTEAQAGSVSADDGKKLTKLESMSEKFASVSDIEIGSTAVSAKSLTGLVITPANITSGTYGSHSECTASETPVTYIGLTLWDSTKGTTPGVGDTVSDKKITAFGSQSTVVNIPLYIDLTDDVDPAPTFSDPTAHTDGGHVELSSTLSSGKFSSTGSAEYDKDTKISGKVVFTGTVSDEKRISSITLTSGKAINSTLTSAVEVASYDTTNGLLKVTDAASATTGWTFALTETTADAQFSVTDGHKVNWTLTLDSSYVENVAASDVLFTLTASDGTNGADATYQVDIVPYITGIVRSKTTNSVVSKTYRSTYGEYPVAIGDTLTVTGYNLPGADVAADATGTYVHVGSTGVATTNETATKQFTFSVPENSGELTVSVNGILSLNHLNNNSLKSNQETAESARNNAKSSTVDGNVLYDNRYIRVWDVGHYFANSVNGHRPTFAADADGNLFSTWALMGTASIQAQRTLSGTNMPVYVCYDQPEKDSWIGIDTKSSSKGALSVMYFPANVGSSATPDSTGYADATTTGGVWGVGIPNDLTTGRTYYTSGQYKHLSINGNPYNALDSKVSSAGWQLSSASMRREIGQFSQPRTVRYGNGMHFVYYDSYNRALRYTYQSVDSDLSRTASKKEQNDQDKKHTDGYEGIISGWNLIDGTSDGQDRVHTLVWAEGGKTDFYTTNTDNITEVNRYSIKMKHDWNPAVGNTIAISYQDSSAVFRIELHKITGVSTSDGVHTISWNDYAYDYQNNTPSGITIYRGDSNVVADYDTTLGSISAAGLYAGLDVTSSGKPVIVYYDMENETLRVAYSSSSSPNMGASDGAKSWKRQSLSGIVSGGTYVQAKIDGNDYLHILYRDAEGNMCYIKSTNAPDGDAYYTFGTPMVVDTSGTYGTLSVIRSGTEGSYTYTPCVSWLNSEGTANGVKYAVLRTVDKGDNITALLWDTMIVPAVKDNFVTGGEYIYTEGYNGWTVTDDSVNTAKCDAIIGYNTGRMDVLFLKSEK